MPGANRTKVGLKHFGRFIELAAASCANRTKVGLKRDKEWAHSLQEERANRTKVGLKHFYRDNIVGSEGEC